MIKSFAKINLFLNVLKKNKDGLHNIQSNTILVKLFDKIKIKKINKKKDLITFNGKFKKEFVKFGEGLIFDESLLHKSADSEESRITLQLRFEEIKYNKFERSVTQKINEKTLAYWKKKFDL